MTSKQFTNQQLTDLWDERGQAHSPVAQGWIDGNGKDSDFMTIVFDRAPERTFERRPGDAAWREVTEDPVPAQVSRS